MPPAEIPLRTSCSQWSIQHDYTAEIVTDSIPSRVVNLYRVRSLPLFGGTVAAAFAIVLLGYTLAVGVRLRTREMGVLRALGMTARRMPRVLADQRMMLTVVMVTIGVPLGLLLGAAGWREIADSLGVGDRTTIPAVLTLLVPSAIACGLLAAVLPSRRVRRHDVAALLRDE